MSEPFVWSIYYKVSNGSNSGRQRPLYLEPAIDPPLPPSPHPRNFVHYEFLKLLYIGNKITHISPLAMDAFACNSHATNVTLKTIQIKNNIDNKVSIFLLTSMLFATNACGFIEAGT